MPRRSTIFQQDYVFHAMNRGAGKAEIFLADEDYLFLLNLMFSYAERMNITVPVYCLMPNRYNLLLKQNGEIPVNDFIRNTFSVYARWFNKKHDRTGTPFEGRFKAKFVEDDFFKQCLCGYILFNPVKENRVARPEDWKYSNARPLLDTGILEDSQNGFIHELFGTHEKFRDFMDCLDLETVLRMSGFSSYMLG